MATDSENKGLPEIDVSSLIAAEKSDEQRAKAAPTVESKPEKPKKNLAWLQKPSKKVAIIAASSVGVLALAGVLVFNGLNQNAEVTAVNEEAQAEAELQNFVAPATGPYKWAKESGSIFPEETNSWQERPHVAPSESEEEKQQKLERYMNVGLGEAAKILPSEEAGFTADDSKAVNEDGTLNPMYSYWTQEQFQLETTQILERLLNPVYGGWATYQYPEFIEEAYPALSNIFSDIIDPKVLESGSGIDAIPVFADWDANDYGMGDQLLTREQGNRWIGKVNSIETNFTFNEETQQYDVILVAKITYSAWTQDKETVTKDATLTLELGANIDKTVPSTSKVVVRSSNLEF